ncbi:MAG: MFS transporter [Candidatus Neomarinimicrobiota bacterium]|nr:MFS transporter [Candidatus Neomarinimicrobiota bacterium]
MHNQKNFRTFLLGAPFIGSIGRSMYDIAIIWLILDITNSEKLTGLIAMTTYLPAIFFGLFTGAIVDMYSKTKVMAVAHIMQAIAVLGIPLFLLFDIRLAWVIMILAFFHNGFSLPFIPAFNAYLPTQIKKDKLLKANSIVNIAWQMAVFIGPIVAAYALTVISIEYLFYVTVICYIITAFVIINAPKDEVGKENVDFSNILKKTYQGLVYLNNKKTLRFIIILTILSNLFVMGPAIVGIPILVKMALGGTASNFAICEAIVGLGMLLGTTFVYNFGDKFTHGKLFLTGLFIDGASFCLYYLIENMTQMYVLSFCHGIGIPLLIISRVAMMQKNIPEKLLGRIFSIISISIISMTAVSSGIIGLASDIFDIQTIFLLFGFMAGLCGIVGFLHPKIKYLN